jgi:hypothetical protein
MKLIFFITSLDNASARFQTILMILGADTVAAGLPLPHAWER